MTELQEAVSDQEVLEGLEEMEEMFDERFDFDPHPATRTAWRELLENGIVRVSRDDGPQGYRVVAELDFLAGMVDAKTFAGPYITTYVMAEEVPHLNLPQHYVNISGNKEEVDEEVERHTDVAETIQEEVSWVNP